MSHGEPMFTNLAIIWDQHRRQAAPRPTPLKWKCRGSDASPETAWFFSVEKRDFRWKNTWNICAKLRITGNHVVKWENDDLM